MDPPPVSQQQQQPALPPVSSAAPTHLHYSDSIDSSPRSRNTDSWDDTTAAPSAATTKLRLMCSYGGHIVPRPHDKSLCYVGGDTRIIVADRHTSLADLSARLAKTLLNSRPFTLKYQLPNEDLDSLISVTTDEDLDNMIEEYDRTSNSPKPSRLRLFLFPTKPDSSQSIGPILESSVKSDDWFLNALNGAGLLNRGFSDSASVNDLLGLDVDANVNNPNSLDATARAEGEVSQGGSSGNNKNAKQGQDVHSVPDSPMLETSSSFGSTSSSPSLANLPPIRVHVEDGGAAVATNGGGIRVQDQRLGIEEQFAQIGVSAGQKQDEGFMVISSPPPMPTTIAAVAAMSSGMVAGEYANRVVSDDERSDHGVPVGYRKPPAQQLQALPLTLPPQPQQKPSGGVDLASPDSVSSESSIANALSRAKPVIYQEQLAQIPSGTSRVSANPADPNTRIQMQQQVVHDPQQQQYVLQHQFDPQQQQQQQFIHAGVHYISHHPGGVPIPAYYPVYHSQQQHHTQLDQQYPVYYMPARPSQAYNMSMQQHNITEAPTATPSTLPQTPPSPAMVQTPAATYNAMRNPPIAKPEMVSGMYRTGASGAPALVQVASSQQQQQQQHQQYVGYSQMQYPSQSVAQGSSAPANYAYEYAEPTHAQIYYTQPLAPTMSAAQYQTMTGAAAAVLPDGSSQHPNDGIKQQIRTS